MKKFLSMLFILLFIACTPAGLADCEQPYFAVYMNQGFNLEWDKYHPDLVFVAPNWEQFDLFLEIVKKKAGKRKILLDIDTHGDDGGFFIQFFDRYGQFYSSGASMGYIVNHVEKYLDEKKVTLIMEGCFSGRAYKNTIRDNFGVDPLRENHKGITVMPIYGIGSVHYNVGNFIYLEYKYNIRPFFEDLRHYELDELEVKDLSTNSPEMLLIRELWGILFLYGA